MTYKVNCPGCGNHTSEIGRGFIEDGKCPKCGLSQDVLHEVWRARESHATAELKEQYEAMAVRAGLAEAKALRLERKLERIQEAVADDVDY